MSKLFSRLLTPCLLTLMPLPVMAAVSTNEIMDVTQLGVIGDGMTLNTANIQKVIETVAAGGGGAVYFPPGRYLTGTIQLKSRVTLQLAENAILLGSTDAADYRNLDPFTDGSGHPLGQALIVAVDAVKVGITGGGTVDGQGLKLSGQQKPYLIRPFLMRWVHCTNVVVQNVHLVNPGAWTLNFFETRNATVARVTIRSRDQHLRNNDGVNIDSSENIHVQDCDIISGDDALVIKSTSRQHPSRDITVRHCKLSTRTNAIKLGTESIGGFENISISDCQITNTKMAGIALYTVDGGDLQDINISNIVMNGVAVPISLRRGARLKVFRDGEQPKTIPGKLQNVTIQDVSARNIGLIGVLINGVSGYPVETVALENIQLELSGGGSIADARVHLPEKESAYPEFDMFGRAMPAYGIYARHVRGLRLKNVQMHCLQPDARPATVLMDAKEMASENSAGKPPD